MSLKDLQHIIIYTDGASRGNPGASAIGVAFVSPSGQTLKEFGERLPNGTNNEAEYMAVVFALKKLRSLVGSVHLAKMTVELRMDSQLVARQITGEYKLENEKVFKSFIVIWNMRQDIGKLIVKHVPREQNTIADRLANEALDEKQQGLFSGRHES